MLTLPGGGGGSYGDDDLALEVLLVFWPSRHIFCQQLFRHMSDGLTFLFRCRLTRASSDRQTGESEKVEQVTRDAPNNRIKQRRRGKKIRVKVEGKSIIRTPFLENPDKSG